MMVLAVAAVVAAARVQHKVMHLVEEEQVYMDKDLMELEEQQDHHHHHRRFLVVQGVEDRVEDLDLTHLLVLVQVLILHQQLHMRQVVVNLVEEVVTIIGQVDLVLLESYGEQKPESFQPLT